MHTHAHTTQLLADIADAQTASATTEWQMTLVLALSYGGRAEIARVAAGLAQAARDGALEVEDIDEALFAQRLRESSGAGAVADLPDPCLILRTGGEVGGVGGVWVGWS